MTVLLFYFFFNDTATTEIYTLSLHDALPICFCAASLCVFATVAFAERWMYARLGLYGAYLAWTALFILLRSEEYTSELQSRQYLVCRFLLEKKLICNRPLSFVPVH